MYYIYIYASIRTYMQAYIEGIHIVHTMHVIADAHIHICACVNASLLSRFAYTHTHMHLHVNTYTLYVYMYIHVHTYACMYTDRQIDRYRKKIVPTSCCICPKAPSKTRRRCLAQALATPVGRGVVLSPSVRRRFWDIGSSGRDVASQKAPNWP